MPEQPSNVSVVQAVDRERFEVSLDGRRAGFTAYLDAGDQRIFYHTEIEEGFAERGLASTLIARALAETHDAGLHIVPVCPFVAKYLKTHHEHDDVVDPVTPAALAAVSQRTG